MEIPSEYKKNLYRALLTLLILLCVHLLLGIAKWDNHESYGIGQPIPSISLSGHGEVKATPDIADISFNISRDATTAKDAQSAVAQVEKKALDFLKSSKIEDKDIRTSNASVYPKYDYKNICPPTPLYVTQPWRCPPVPGSSVISGYTASESIT